MSGRFHIAPRLGWAAVLVAFASVWLLGSSAARACSCAPPQPPLAAADLAAVVFEGRPEPATVEGHRNRYTFAVDRIFKGDVGATAVVYTATSGAACGRSFDATVSYLVYAYESGNGKLGDGMCTRTRPSYTAGPDFAALGPGRPVAGSESNVDVNDPVAEPPRIKPEPPPVAPSKRSRGCGVAELPHDPRLTWILLAILVALGLRRGIGSRPCRSASSSSPRP